MTEDIVADRLALDAGRTLELASEIQRYPGKRIIRHGRVDGQPVVAKFYLGRVRGWWEWLRGLRGTRALMAAGVPTAPLVYAGFCSQVGAWLTVVEYIAADEDWPPRGPNDDPRGHARAHDLLIMALARLHQAGLVQNDLNWTNFIPRAGTLHAIDGDRVRAFPPPLSRAQSLTNVSRLYAYKSDFGHEAIRRGYRLYCDARDWEPAEREFGTLLTRIHRDRRRVGDQFVRRSLKGWKHFPLHHCGQWRCIRDRRRVSLAVVEELVAALDATAADAAMGTDAVRELMTSSSDAYRVQRFAPQGDGVSARLAWSRTLLFRRLRIPAERPAVLIESRPRRSRGVGYLITCRRDSVTLLCALTDCGWLQQQTLLHRVGEVLALIWLVDLELVTGDAAIFAVADSELLVRHPELTRTRARAPYPQPPEALVESLAQVCGHSTREVREAINSGMGAAVPSR